MQGRLQRASSVVLPFILDPYPLESFFPTYVHFFPVLNPLYQHMTEMGKLKGLLAYWLGSAFNH